MATKVVTKTTWIRCEARLSRKYHWLGNVKEQDTGKIVNATSLPSPQSDTRSTSDDPRNWRELVRQHRNATTYLTGTKWHVDIPNGYARADWKARWDNTPNVAQYSEIRGCIPVWTNTMPNTYTQGDLNALAESEAKIKLFKELKDKRTAFEGGVFLGELAETVRMLRRPLSGIRDGMSDYLDRVKKRGRRSNVQNLNRMVAGTWLETMYGILPLASDVENAQEALNRQLDRYEALYQRFKVQSDIKDSVSNFTTYSLNPTIDRPWIFYCKYRRVKTSSVRYYGQVYTAALSAKRMSRANWGLTLNEFVPTIWELIPYSFVVDYFTNTGDLISAACTYTGDVRWISRTSVVTGSIEHYLSSYSCVPRALFDGPVTGLSHTVLAPHPLVISQRNVSRSPTSVPTLNPLKDFRMKVPGAGSFKWLNLTALVSQSRSVERWLGSLAR